MDASRLLVQLHVVLVHEKQVALVLVSHVGLDEVVEAALVVGVVVALTSAADGVLDLDVVLLQGLKSNEYLNSVISELGKDWSTNKIPDKDNSTAIISKFNGQLESLTGPSYGVTLFGILKENKVIRFVSCEAMPGRSSMNRREIVDWLLSERREAGESTVVTGNFYFNPNDRWNLISPLLTDSISIDRSSWRALSLLGNVISYRHSDPLGVFSWKLHKNREWIIVDPSIEIVDTSLSRIL